ncbi:MAG: [protein-PII] uridylyltransferase [Nitrospinae bacterium]|nr:[protein-PII] uridylyltransferase [Nitrospinota bacterium]
MTAEQTGALRQVIEEKRAVVRAEHEKGADGVTVCQSLASIVDEVIIGLFEAEKEGFDGALVALGGYGRGVMNPFSDVDLLFLLRDSRPKSGSAKPPHGMLARLWDLGLKVGHSARSVADTISMGLADIISRTSMIECRFLAGDRDLYDEFRKKYARDVIHYRPHDFIKAKMDEMAKRHATFGRAVKLTEPNIKESRGGLRDFNTALWVIQAKLEVKGIDELASRGLMDREEAAPVNEAYSTLLRLRNTLHWRSNKASDTLVQALQPDIARMEGFEGSDNVAAAALMKKYFNAATVIDRFTVEMLSVAEEYKRKRLFWGPRIRIDADGLFASEGKLHVNAFPPAEYGPDGGILLKIARRLSDEGLEPAPNLVRGLRKLAHTAPDEWFTGPAAGELLASILKLKNGSVALGVFHEAGILIRFIPEFADITGLSQFDMFHRFSTDEHTINALRKFEEIPGVAPVAPQMKEIYRAKRNIEITKLALLLHDLGKRAEDHHAVEDDTRSERILTRLGLERFVEPVRFLVNRHLLMSVTAQRRDFSVPATLRHFCNEVGDRIALRRLYLLTYADIAAVGPEVWNDWKDQLLSELYNRAEKYYIEGEAIFLSDEEQIAALTKLAAVELGSVSMEGSVREFLSMAPERYVKNADPQMVAMDIRQVDRLKTNRVALRYAMNPGDQSGKLTLAAKERIGFFSIISGAFAAKNISIVDAQIHTLAGHTALDTITVGGNLGIFSDPPSLKRLETELGELLDGKKDIEELVARRKRYVKQEDLAGQAVGEPQVEILNHLSETNSVVEIWAPDRIGLLYDVTRTFAHRNLDITSAKISTEGPTAINVFYVTTAEGSKLESVEEQRALEAALLHAIQNPMGQG